MDRSSSNIIRFPAHKAAPPSINIEDIAEKIANVIRSKFKAEVTFVRGDVSDNLNDGNTYKFDINDDASPYQHVLVRPAKPLSEKDIELSKQLLVELFLPAARLEARSTALKQYESLVSRRGGSISYIDDYRTEDSDDDVIPLYDLDSNLGVEVDFRVLLLEGESTSKLYKFASEAHEATNNWAFLSWNDVRPRVTNVQDLESMKGCSLYVPSIASMSIAEIALIWDYIKSEREGALIIFACQGSVEDLAESLKLAPAFVERLNSKKLSVDRIPLSHVDMKDLLELLSE